MDFDIYPQTDIEGRVTNIPELSHSYRGTVYTKIFLYLYDDKTALLMPIIAFNKVAKKFVRFTQQGDFLKIKIRISPVPNRGYLNPTLVAVNFVFLEPLKMRQMYHGDTGKELKMLFPVVPQNYSKAKNSSSQPQRNTKEKSSSASHVKVVSAEIESGSSNKSKSASSKPKKFKTDKMDTGNWIRHANKIGTFKFPNKEKGDK